MSIKIAAIVGKIVADLEDLTSEERKRAIAGALAILGESSRVSETNDSLHSAAGGEDDATISANAVRWMQKNGLSRSSIEEAFHINNGRVSLILGQGIGKSKREQTANTYLLTGTAAFIESGKADFSDEVARQNCSAVGCYDGANHGRYLKDFGNQITGSKNVGWTLTGPGLTAASALLKTIATH